MKTVDYGKLISLEKQRAFYAGRIYALKQVTKHYRAFMSDEFGTLMLQLIDDIESRKNPIKEEITAIVSEVDKKGKCLTEEDSFLAEEEEVA